MGKSKIIISYDISNDKNRTKIHKKLKKNKWLRIQYSVFAKNESMQNVLILLTEIKPFVNPTEGESVYVFRTEEKLLQISIDDLKLFRGFSIKNEQIFI